jgi:hypothetical protein
MSLHGHACPQFAPKNFGAEGMWTSALPLKKKPCEPFELPVRRVSEILHGRSAFIPFTAWLHEQPFFVPAISILRE